MRGNLCSEVSSSKVPFSLWVSAKGLWYTFDVSMVQSCGGCVGLSVTMTSYKRYPRETQPYPSSSLNRANKGQVPQADALSVRKEKVFVTNKCMLRSLSSGTAWVGGAQHAAFDIHQMHTKRSNRSLTGLQSSPKRPLAHSIGGGGVNENDGIAAFCFRYFRRQDNFTPCSARGGVVCF